MYSKYGLLGEKLGHSFSPYIHSLFGEYQYDLYEKNSDELEAFLKNGKWNGINVTIPYKKAVIPYLDVLSSSAEKVGSVNTIIRDENNKLTGYNTDYDGFMHLIKKSRIDIENKKVLILGTGGASLAVKSVITDLNAAQTVFISRNGEDNYNNIEKHFDAQIIINTTPVGMYPNNLISPLSLDGFEKLEAVFDIIYNPQKTKLMLDAEKRNIPSFSGLDMLVYQAKRASELFINTEISEDKAEKVYKNVSTKMKSIILVGMPGCGKSSIGKTLSEKLSREFIDLDSEIIKRENRSIPEIFSEVGEDGFRKIETEVVKDFCKLSEKIIATGGGVVTREENFDPIKQNSVVIFINRDIDVLPTDGRPLSQQNKLSDMYKLRLPLYRHFCDREIDGNGSIDEVTNRILEVLEK